MELRKWAAEGLSFLTMEADVKVLRLGTLALLITESNFVAVSVVLQLTINSGPGCSKHD